MTYALKLDGISGSINVPDTANIRNLSNITIDIIMTANSAGQNGTGRLIYKGTKDLLISLNKIQFVHTFSITSGDWNTPIDSIGFNQRYRVTVTYDNSTVTNNPIIYINGISQIITQTSIPNGTANNDITLNLNIGNNSANSRTFDGFIYQVAYINNQGKDAATIASEATSLSNGSIKPSDIPGCVLYHDYTTIYNNI